MGSVPETAGMIGGLVVVGAGPDLPDVGEQKRASSFSGVILVDSKPAAEVPVELCPELGLRIRTSPCEDSPIVFRGKTDADGRFTFADVPLGVYGVAVKPAESWKITESGAYGVGMQEGKPFDLGKLKFGP
jgi:hypothetical protein